MNITKDTVPSVTYTLTVDGQELESTGAENPLVYLHGANGMIPGFEKELEGLGLGDKFDFSVNAAEGYGEVFEQAIVELPKTNFEVEGVFQAEIVKEGATIPMQDQEGNPMRGIVKNVSDEMVKIDFNHPLAGKDLHFSGEVVSLRAAEQEELEHGHVHGPGGHQH